MATVTADLAQSKLFKFVGAHESTFQNRVELAHSRAKAIAGAYGLTTEDILTCSEKFWNMFLDMTCAIDGGAVALWTIHYNLAAGTIATFLTERPDLRGLMDDVVAFRVRLQFMLTELGHGLDAPNLETTATVLPTGEFDLHTPHNNAAKYMPPTIPTGDIPSIAVVFARLIVQGQDHGVRPFIVALNDGKSMCRGVTARVLPNRFGSKPIGHAITDFNHVRLPPTSLLGRLESGDDRRLDFLTNISRVGVGSIVLTAVVIPALKIFPYIVGEYSKRRTVTAPNGKVVPLITFRTQHAPIFHALAQSVVLEAFYKSLRPFFADWNTPQVVIQKIQLRNALSTVFKVIAVRLWRDSGMTLTDRCGAQGLFEHNQLISSELELRGATVAEGDVLVLSIRLTSELLLGRYEVPRPKNPSSLLSRHEQGIFEELKCVLFSLEGQHRTTQFNRKVLPRSMELAEAIGLRMAYEAAEEAKIDPLLLDLFEINAVKCDVAWYVENRLISGRQELYDREEEVITALEPRLDELLGDTGAEPYTHAPISSQSRWDKFHASLPVLQGNAMVDLTHPTRLSSRM